MATSRTGTAHWKNIRKKIIQQGIDNGTNICPVCKTALDYNTARKPNSPEVDHIVPHAHGGTDDPSNLRIVCRECNQRMGARQRRPRPNRQTATVTTLLDW